MTIEEIQKSTEFQVFDRKSARIDAKALAITIIAFANADGGQIALGVEDDGSLTGVDGKTEEEFLKYTQYSVFEKKDLKYWFQFKRNFVVIKKLTDVQYRRIIELGKADERYFID